MAFLYIKLIFVLDSLKEMDTGENLKQLMNFK